MAVVGEVNPGAAGQGCNFGASLAASTALLQPRGILLLLPVLAGSPDHEQSNPLIYLSKWI